MDQMSQMTVTFRCPPELEPILPRPIPAVQGMPDWFKAMPQKGYSVINQKDLLTRKKCPPVIDAMAYGFLIPLVSDLKVANGEFFWDRDVPGGGDMAELLGNVRFTPKSGHWAATRCTDGPLADTPAVKILPC